MMTLNQQLSNTISTITEHNLHEERFIAALFY